MDPDMKIPEGMPINNRIHRSRTRSSLIMQLHIWIFLVAQSLLTAFSQG